ncbi:hypothetical protein [Methylotenera sp.]|uniref:hypothetical protein n=1 Tax=Methylotenera sp. TaxID=2051956 RepID=UPI0025CC777F|nr:hypothetical protein [Methylotenera sp.]
MAIHHYVCMPVADKFNRFTYAARDIVISAKTGVGINIDSEYLLIFIVNLAKPFP